MNDKNWRSEYLDLKGRALNQRQCELLEKGPDSLSSSWLLQAMYNDWKRVTGYVDPNAPVENTGQLQSSFKSFNRQFEK
jgi:hypothetical protein|tara:strand:- start:569 stop:805 length:237 start_codon:yes stop_codon:yes gene_type:complete